MLKVNSRIVADYRFCTNACRRCSQIIRTRDISEADIRDAAPKIEPGTVTYS